MHAHKCRGCGHIWEHGEENAGSFDAHACTQCGKLQFMHYTGPIEISMYMVSQLAPNVDTKDLASGTDVLSEDGLLFIFFERGRFYKRPVA